MQRTPWLSLAIALIFFVSGILLVFLLPETLPEQPRSRSPESPKSASDHDNNNELSSSPSTSKLSSSLDALTASICSLITSTTTLLSSRPSALLLTIFLAAGFTLSATVTFLLQYTSERFTWSVAHASIFPTTESLTKTLLLTLALPLLKRYLSSASPPPPPPSAASSSSSPTTLPTHRAQKTDRLLLSTSLALTATGLSLLPFAPTPALALLATVLFSLGAGFHSLARSLLSSVVPADNVGRAFALAATVQMVGTAAAGPVLGGVYAWGLERGGVWRGSVWWVAGGVVWVVGMGVWGVGVEGQESAVGNWDHQGEGRGRRGLRRERERERQREGDEESLSGREDDGDDEEAEDEGEGEGVGDRDRDGGGRGEERRNLLRRH
ncbi:hypothetical protein MMC10_008710 [Thelotrema lepadinum]|nr:hypothetical protein [Thelotrema lepadinum]